MQDLKQEEMSQTYHPSRGSNGPLDDGNKRLVSDDSSPVPKTNVSYVSTFVKVTPDKKDDVLLISLISVGKQHCQGEELRASLALINKTFRNSHVIFILADTLQRFTHQIHGFKEGEAEKLSVENGEKWQAAHEEMIKRELTNLRFSFIHWNELTREEINYQKCKTMIDQKYSQDEKFKRKFDKTAMDFLSAQLDDERITFVDTDKGFRLCLEYLKEECAVEIILADKKVNDRKIDYEIYPRNMTDALRATHEAFIPKNILTYLPVKNKVASVSERRPSNSDACAFFKSAERTSAHKQETSPCKRGIQPQQGGSSSPSQLDNGVLSLAYFRSVHLILSENEINPEIRISLVKKILVDAERILLQGSLNNFDEMKPNLQRGPHL